MTRNPDARRIRSDGGVMWVLEDRRNALFAYDLATHALLAEYALDGSNSQPHGIWSDGHTVWVSDHNAKRRDRAVSLAGADRPGDHDVPGALDVLAARELRLKPQLGFESFVVWGCVYSMDCRQQYSRTSRRPYCS